MFNFRWGFIFAAFAMIFSVGLGIFNDVRAVHIFIRALFFSVIFFGMGCGLRYLVSSYFPELLFTSGEPVQEESTEKHGSLIDITLGSVGEYAVPEMFKDDDQEIGNIEDLISGSFRQRSSNIGQNGIDRTREEVYNTTESQAVDNEKDISVFSVERQELPPSAVIQPERFSFTPSVGDSGGLEGLPDLDVMAQAFSPAFSREPEPAAFQPIEVFEQVQYNKGNKPHPLPGDFNPKELAEGIRTVLVNERIGE